MYFLLGIFVSFCVSDVKASNRKRLLCRYIKVNFMTSVSSYNGGLPIYRVVL